MTKKTLMLDYGLVHAGPCALEGGASILVEMLWTKLVGFIAQFYEDF